MKFETKYNKDDLVWILYKDKILHKKVHSIKCESSPWNSAAIAYFINIGDDDKFESHIVEEDKCFATKEELIKSLD